MDLSTICLHCFKMKGNNEFCPFCGNLGKPKQSEAYHLPAGVLLNKRYLLGKVLGFGGFGVTYMALDLKLNSIVAIKEYFPTSLVCRVPGELNVSIFSGERIEDYKKGLNRFLEEARNMAAFSHDPHIVKVFDFFIANKTAYIVMEYLDGITFDQYIKNSGGTIPVEEAVSIIVPVLEGLRTIHENGVYHRDLNPKNIMITKDFKVKIIDFGAAKFCSSDDQTRADTVTHGYAPPEQYQVNGEQGAFTDIYAVGATLYRAVVGYAPPRATDRLTFDEIVNPSDLIPDFPKNIDVAIMNSLALKASLRYQNVDDLIFVLTDDSAKLEYVEKKEHARQVRKYAFVIAGLATALILAVIIIFATQKNDFVYNSLNNKIEKEETISIYIPYESKESDSAEFLKENFDSIAEDFKKEYGKNITVNPILIEESEYEQAVNDAGNTDDKVCIFRSDYNNITMKRADLSVMFNDIKADNYLLESEMKKQESAKRRIPTGFDIGVMYINNDILNSGSISSWSEYLNSADDDDTILLAKDSTAYLYYSLKNDKADSNTAADVLMRTMPGGKLPGNDPYITFSDRETGMLIGTCEKGIEILDSCSSFTSGNLLKNDDQWYGRFTDYWSVSDSISESKKAAAILFLHYLLSKEAQKNLYDDVSTNMTFSVNSEIFKEQITHGKKVAQSLFEDYNGKTSDVLDQIQIIKPDDEAVRFETAFVTLGEKGGNNKETIKKLTDKYFNGN